MTEPVVAGTRERILAEARELFIQRGYPRTSLRLIADRLGVSKAAVLYHFTSKDQLLIAMATPLLLDLEGVLAVAEQQPPEQARWTVLEGWLETMSAHRRSLRMLRQDMAFLAAGEVYHRFLSVAERAHLLVAGPNAGLAGQVRAAQAVGMLGDPLVYLHDVPTHELLPTALEGVRRLFGPEESGPARAMPTPVDRRTGAVAGEAHGRPGPQPARAAGDPARSAGDPARSAALRTPPRGRPSVMNARRRAEADRLLAAGETSPTQIATTLGVSRATVYRYLATRDGERPKVNSETP